ncbi:MAG: radical SAM protein [Caldilineales bacterium]|nr:radical SAM protein [Caldilineales bacterium]MCW5857433.1 SPASM domain-containing protein [Caldilineales bacterium]
MPTSTIELTTRTTLAPALPTQLYIEVTNYCNSLCVSCPLTYDHFLPIEPKHHLSWENFRRIVDQVPEIRRAVLHGIGEPLLNRDLPRFVAHLKERGAWVLFNTNAVLLDRRRGDALAEAGLDELRVSLDAVTPDLYARLRGIDALPRILDNLRDFVARHGGRERPRLSLWFVGMHENLHQLPAFVRLGADLGAPEVYLQRLVFFGDGERIAENATMVPEQSLFASLEQQQAALIVECERLAAELGLKFQASGATTPHESVAVKGDHPWQGCMRPWRLMYITANGNALPCCIAPFATPDYGSILLGNVFAQPLAEVWNGPRYQDLRAAVLSQAPSPRPCQFCGVKWSL